MPTPIAAIAVIGICCERMAKLPSVAKRSSSGVSRLQPITTTRRTSEDDDDVDRLVGLHAPPDRVAGRRPAHGGKVGAGLASRTSSASRPVSTVHAAGRGRRPRPAKSIRKSRLAAISDRCRRSPWRLAAVRLVDQVVAGVDVRRGAGRSAPHRRRTSPAGSPARTAAGPWWRWSCPSMMFSMIFGLVSKPPFGMAVAAGFLGGVATATVGRRRAEADDAGDGRVGEDRLRDDVERLAVDRAGADRSRW